MEFILEKQKGSGNTRNSSVDDISFLLKRDGYEIVYFDKSKEDLARFVMKVDVVLSNRMNEELIPFLEKVYTIDLFKND